MSAVYPATPEQLERAAARQYSEQALPPTGFGELLDADPNLSPAFKRAMRLSAVKLEEIAADARAEDLWIMRGGRDE